MVRLSQGAGVHEGVSGVIDETSTDALREAIRDCSAGYTEDLTIDLSDVDFLPSDGVGALAGVMKQAEEHGHSIELTVCQGSIIERVLTIVGLPHSVV